MTAAAAATKMLPKLRCVSRFRFQPPSPGSDFLKFPPHHTQNSPLTIQLTQLNSIHLISGQRRPHSPLIFTSLSMSLHTKVASCQDSAVVYF